MPVDVLGDDVAEVSPREGKVNARGTHGRVVAVLKVLRDKVLRPGLAHGYVAPELDPDVAGLDLRPLVEINSHTADVGGGSLEGTLDETLLDDRLVTQHVRRLVFIINEDFDFGGHGGSY